MFPIILQAEGFFRPEKQAEAPIVQNSRTVCTACVILRISQKFQEALHKGKISLQTKPFCGIDSGCLFHPRSCPNPGNSGAGLSAMLFSVATWNINSVRLRLPLVIEFLQTAKPDILCLQETKCPDGHFPRKALQAAGYDYLTISGQKGYHGVAILSRLPFTETNRRSFCYMNDCRHIAVTIQAGGRKIRLHNFYIPAGGDDPDPHINPKFAHKLQFLEEMKTIRADYGDNCSSLLAGDLNIAPLEHDVWSHKQLLKIVSHTPIETDSLKQIQSRGGWIDLMREKIPEPEKIFTWWSYRAKDWETSNRGRRLDHIWGSADLAPLLRDISILQEARGWEKPSDHVPVIAHFNFD